MNSGERKSKRSGRVGLMRMNGSRMKSTMGLLAGGAVMLAGCGSDPVAPPAPKDNTPKTDVVAFDNAFDCKAKTGMTQDECVDARSQAIAVGEKTAPRFEAIEDCEGQWGAGGCIEQKATTGGGSFFVPFMAGFMISNLIGGGKREYLPLYRRSGSQNFATAKGDELKPGRKPGSYFLARHAFRMAADAVENHRENKVRKASALASRGGFTRASERGWRLGSSSGSSSSRWASASRAGSSRGG